MSGEAINTPWLVVSHERNDSTGVWVTVRECATSAAALDVAKSEAVSHRDRTYAVAQVVFWVYTTAVLHVRDVAPTA